MKSLTERLGERLDSGTQEAFKASSARRFMAATEMAV